MTHQTAKYLDEAATARLLNVSARTLQRWRAEGGGPAFIRLGVRRVAYSMAEIERWTAGNTFPHHAAELAQRAAA